MVLDFSKYMHGIRELDPTQRHAWVEPGIILDDLRSEAEKHNLTFGPDPATHTHCTIGGMIGNNSCGVHALMAGKTVDNIDELDVLTYDGLRLRVGPTSEAQLTAFIDEGGRRGEIYRALRDIRDRYAESIGLKGIRVDRPERVGPAWDEAMAADRPCVIEFITDPEVPPLPPHISPEQARNFIKSLLHDPDRGHMLKQSLKEMLEAFRK